MRRWVLVSWSSWSSSLLLCFVTLSFLADSCQARRRTSEEWNNLWAEQGDDLDGIEQAWQVGDEDPELKTEDQYEFERIERRKNAAPEPPPDGEDPNAWAAHAAAP